MQDVAIWLISVDVVRVTFVASLIICYTLNISYSFCILLELLFRGLPIDSLDKSQFVSAINTIFLPSLPR